MSPKFLIGVAWYSEEQWTLLKLVADDRESLDETYRKWEAGAQKALEHLQKDPGIHAVNIPVEIEVLRRWCREHGKRLDSPARSEFVVETVRTMSTGGELD